MSAVKLLLLDTDIGMWERAAHILRDAADYSQCGEYTLWPEVNYWCLEHIGPVTVEHHPDDSAELTFVDEGARLLFILNYDLGFVFEYLSDREL